MTQTLCISRLGQRMLQRLRLPRLLSMRHA